MLHNGAKTAKSGVTPADWQKVRAFIFPPIVTLARARQMAATVTGLARLSGYSRMQVHRLVRSGRVQLGTEAALHWSWRAAGRNFADPKAGITLLPRNSPRRRAIIAFLKAAGLLRPPGKPQEKGVDLGTVGYVARSKGDPRPAPADLTRYAELARQIEAGEPVARLLGVKRRRRQQAYVWVLRAAQDCQATSLRSVAAELSVAPSTLSRWFSAGGHLDKYRGKFFASLRARFAYFAERTEEATPLRDADTNVGVKPETDL